MTFRLQYRKATPKGALGKTELVDNLSADDLIFEIRKLLEAEGARAAVPAWVYFQRNDLYFPGKTETTEEIAARKARK